MVYQINHDLEGRVITLELNKYYLVHVYTPNSGENLKRLEYRENGISTLENISRN